MRSKPWNMVGDKQMSRDLQCLDSTLSIVLSCGARRHNPLTPVWMCAHLCCTRGWWATSAISSCSERDINWESFLPQGDHYTQNSYHKAWIDTLKSFGFTFQTGEPLNGYPTPSGNHSSQQWSLFINVLRSTLKTNKPCLICSSCRLIP